MESTTPARDAAMLSVAEGLAATPRHDLDQPQPQRAPRVAPGLTMLGVALIALQCAALALVVAALVWFPESAQGIRLRTPKGLMLAAFVLSGGMSCLALGLQALGFEIARRGAPPH